ncbi:reverse transcriptase domain-containing protein, partial [Thiolapillus sp.]|uniref:reverse transcriptase domain-containing protein n=1 Tax=Thiolapillus sp. TaxID=2017437 RepID=UPI003AF93119
MLLHRLHHDFGIQGTALDWFSSYLTNRTQSVSIHCYTSEPAPISFGVPQGSVLGPVLFVLFTVPLPTVIEKHSVLHHSYADDSQLQKSAPPHQIPDLFLSMQKCIDDIKSWMTLNKLKLNDDKTEAMIVSSGRKSRSLSFSFPDFITVGCASVPLSDSVKNLGVTFDCHLTMKTHVSNLVRSANFELRRISSIRHLLSTDATKTLVSAFVLSRLDYCNSLLFGCPQYLLNKLQKVQNNAARLVLRVSKTDHISPHLASLHWLPIDSRIQYKLSSLCYNCLNSTAPDYLTELLRIYKPTRQLRSSSDTSILCIPTVRTHSLGQRSFFLCCAGSL